MLAERDRTEATSDPPEVSRVATAPAGIVSELEHLSLLLAGADLGVLVISYVVTLFRVESYTVWPGFPEPSRLVVWSAVLASIWLPVAVNLGAYDRGVITHPLRNVYVTAKATVIAGALFHLVPLVGGPVYSRLASATVVLAFVCAMVVWRALVSKLLPVLPARELVVLGAGWAGQTLAEAIALHPKCGFRINAFVDIDAARVGCRERNIMVHPLAELDRLVHSTGGRARVVLAIPDEAHAAVYEELTALAQAGVRVLSMASVYEEVTGRVPVRHLGNLWWAMLPSPSGDIVYRMIKRIVDVSLALLGLLVLGISLPVVAILVRLESRGPLFFSQRRVGWNGKSLRVIKLRTLAHGPRAYADNWERKRANTTSRIGALLRATGVDELPQCWNVLRGEMSIVGPRPYVSEEVDEFQRQIPFFRCRSLVKPGLTGWAQVNWGYGFSLEDEIEKLQYDLYYVGHQSFYLDLLIVLRTLQLALRRARPNPVLAVEPVSVTFRSPGRPATE